GTDPDCPADAKSTDVCRPAAGDCDVAESCDGTSDDCPPDSVAGAFLECRPSAGACDAAENCTGTAVDCPVDTFQPSTVECRSSAGACDTAESCTGSSADCPADAKSSGVCRPVAGS